MITENFRSDVRIRLDYLHIEQTRFPSKYELYKNAISLLFRTENALESINILEAYNFLIEHYEKVRKAMSDKKWVALDTAHFAIGRVSLKRKINKNLIYITNYLSKEPQMFYADKNEFKQEPFVRSRQKNKPPYDTVYDNGEYYLFKKGSNKDYKNAIGKYSTGRYKKSFFARIELLNTKQINTKEVMEDFIKSVEITNILELTLVNTMLISTFKLF